MHLTSPQFFALGAAFALSNVSLAAAQPAAPRAPNIIYIMADDLGYADVGPFGQTKIHTPNIDRMGKEGTCFLNFYPGASVCAPTRSTLMTGLHTGHTRIRGNHGENGVSRVPLRPDDTTITEVLHRAGYATGMMGKWGLGEPDTTGLPNKKGFDRWVGYLNQDLAEDYYPEKIWENDHEITLTPNLGGKKGLYSNDLFTQEALKFIEENKARPFFLYLPYTIPHLFWQVPDDSLAEYAGKFPEEAPDEESKHVGTTTPRATYAAMVTRLDRYVGQIFRQLADLGLDDNTIVFFCSDNGAPAHGGVSEFFNSNGPFRGNKSGLYEGGIHTEMIARWPGKIPAGARSKFAWAGWDFFPTAAELAKVPVPAGLDGISVLPALTGHAAARDGYLYWEDPAKEFAQAVRVGDLKAICPARGQPMEVYDLAKDPGETQNIAATHPDFVARAQELFRTSRTPSLDYPGPERADIPPKKPKPSKQPKK